MQVSQDVPNNANNPPIDLNQPVDVILYLILPALLIIFYFVWRYYKKKG